jgi:hypothetical protein
MITILKRKHHVAVYSVVRFELVPEGKWPLECNHSVCCSIVLEILHGVQYIYFTVLFCVCRLYNKKTIEYIVPTTSTHVLAHVHTIGSQQTHLTFNLMRDVPCYIV